MSYTIPQYVDTQEQAILAVASAVKGEQVTGGDGGVNTALDILADTLAGENVQVPMTDQGAILALAQYVDGMVKPEGTITITENGEDIDVAQYATADVSVSGGVTLGTISSVFVDDITVAAGDEINGVASITSISVGGQTVTDTSVGIIGDPIGSAAAGATVEASYYYIEDDSPLEDVVFRWCTLNTETYTYATISAQIDLAATTSTKTIGSNLLGVATFVMPEPPTEGACLLLSAVPASD